MARISFSELRDIHVMPDTRRFRKKMSKLLDLQECIRCENVAGVKSLLEATRDLDLNQADGLLSKGLRVFGLRCWDETVVLRQYDGKQASQFDSPLQYLCGNHWNEEIFHILLAAGADVNWGSSDICRPPLVLAIRPGNIDAVKTLVENGADVNSSDYFGNSPITQAAHKGEHEIAKWLLEHGADIYHCNLYGESALEIACEQGCVKMFCYIFDTLSLTSSDRKREAETARRSRKNRFKPREVKYEGHYLFGSMYRNSLVKAFEGGTERHIQCAEVLIRAGCNLELTDDGGTDPLLCAVHYRSIPAVKLLIRSNCDVNRVANTRYGGLVAPLQMALRNLSLQSVVAKRSVIPMTKLLLTAGCQPPVSLYKYEDDASCEILAELADVIATNQWSTLPLIGLCRLAIRKQMSCVHFQKNVQELPLPKSLKDFIFMNDEL